MCQWVAVEVNLYKIRVEMCYLNSWVVTREMQGRFEEEEPKVEDNDLLIRVYVLRREVD